jgi:hypothetical protein
VALGVGPLWRRVLCVRRFRGVSVCVGCVCRSGDGAVCLVGLRGVGPALAGRLWGGRAFALRAGEERVFASNARSDPAPRAPGGWGGAGGGAVVEEGALCAPVPWGVGLCGLCLSVWRWVCMPGGASRGRACARREALGRKGFRAARWGIKGVRLQCSLRPGPAGARLGAASQWPVLSGNAAPATRPVRPALLRGRGLRG